MSTSAAADNGTQLTRGGAWGAWGGGVEWGGASALPRVMGHCRIMIGS